MRRNRYDPYREDDPLYHIWEKDNHRDPKQHIVVLRLSGRPVTKRQGHQDYWRQQQLQRASKHRFFRCKQRENHGQLLTDPDAVINRAVSKTTAEHVLSTVSDRQALALKLVCGLDLSISEAANTMSLSERQMRQLLKQSLSAALGNFA